MIVEDKDMPKIFVIGNDELESGMVLVASGNQRVILGEIEPSSIMHGLLRVETDLGVLYLDPDSESTVEI